jgi:hypothetical protein
MISPETPLEMFQLRVENFFNARQLGAPEIAHAIDFGHEQAGPYITILTHSGCMTVAGPV